MGYRRQTEIQAGDGRRWYVRYIGQPERQTRLVRLGQARTMTLDSLQGVEREQDGGYGRRCGRQEQVGQHVDGLGTLKTVRGN